MNDLIQRLRSGTHNEEPVTVGGVEHDRRCLEAADEIERLRTPRIKPLEWGEPIYFERYGRLVKTDDGFGWVIKAKSVTGGFLVRCYVSGSEGKQKEAYYCWDGHGTHLYEGPSLEEAKAAAETEYRNRVMSALMED